MSLKRKVLFKAAEFDLDQSLIKIYESLTGQLDWMPDISVEEEIKSGKYVQQQNKGDVLLPLFIPTEQMCLRTFLLGYAFQIHGYQPTIIYNINTLPESINSTDSNTYDMGVARTKSQFRWFADRFPVNCVSIGDILQDEQEMAESIHVTRDPNASYTHCGVDISDAAMATTRKDLRRYSIDLNKEDHYQSYCKYISRGTMIAESVQRLIDRHDIEVLLSWDVFYTRGRIPLKICAANGIRAYTHEDGYTRGEIGYGNMDNRVPNWRYIDQELVSTILESTFSDKKQSQIEEIMNKRRSSDPDYNDHTIGADSFIETSAGTTARIRTLFGFL
jgi:hypothetical protein